MRLHIEEIAVGLRDRVQRVVDDDELLLVQEAVAFRAEPLEAVDLARPAPAFLDQQEGVGREARRMRDQRRGVDRLARLQNLDGFLPVRVAVVQVHLARDHVHDLGARVDVELAAVFAAAGDEEQGFRLLPQHMHPTAGLGKLAGDGVQIAYRHW